MTGFKFNAKKALYIALGVGFLVGALTLFGLTGLPNWLGGVASVLGFLAIIPLIMEK